MLSALFSKMRGASVNRAGQSGSNPQRAIPASGLVRHGGAADVQSAAPLASSNGADGTRSLARKNADPKCDENAWGSAGSRSYRLFGTAGAVGSFAQAVLQTIAGERLLAEPSRFASSFDHRWRQLAGPRLGHDAPTSSCGTRMSSTSIGHTGFCGVAVD
jgi:hypothetical protein